MIYDVLANHRRSRLDLPVCDNRPLFVSSEVRTDMSYRDVTPDDVLGFTAPTSRFLCPLNANVYNIDFLSFTIRDYESKKKIFEVGRDTPNAAAEPDIDYSNFNEDSYRKIKYGFSEDVLRLPTVSTTLVFSVGEREVRDYRMIERHYFRDRLIKSFDFRFGFCIPNSTNTWDAVYSLPPMEEGLINEMVAHPYETVSDSFYFVGETLVMHNKASYKYIEEDRAQSKRTYDDDYEDYKARKAAAKGGAPGGGGGAKAAAKGAPPGAEAKGAAKSQSKYGDDRPAAKFSKESDYF